MAYFDHNATTPLASVAREAWLKTVEELWHNPSSPYRAAARAKLKLDGLREILAGILECRADQIVFTSGATEAANAVFSHLGSTLPANAIIAVNPTEHPCVLAAAGAHFGGRLRLLTVGADGVVDPNSVTHALTESQDAGVSGRVAAMILMAANNETGVLQPWRDVAGQCRTARIPLICDASQWLGKLPGAGLGSADWVFGAAHKFGGPKGAGFVKLPEDADGFRILQGGEQEVGHRAGTEDLAGIASMVAALVDAEQHKVLHEFDRLKQREEFERTVVGTVRGVEIVAPSAERLWNTLSLIMPHSENHRWVAKLDRAGFQVSTGSACATGKEGPSHVLAAMGVAPDRARRVIRISAGWETTRSDWAELNSALQKVDAELRATANPAVVDA